MARKNIYSKLLGALVCGGLLAFAGVASAAVDKVICVPWQGDVYKQHTAISGQGAQLKGVIKTTNTAAVYYKWVFGDGTETAFASLSGATKYNVEATHTYTAAKGTPFTAKLQVSNTSPFALAEEDPYLLKIEDNEINARINISIDRGLWWLYQQGNNHGYTSYPHTTDGSPPMTWLQTSYVGTLVTPTASAVHAFGINGHKVNGNPDEDPYAEAVQFGMNYIVRGFFSSNPALRAYPISSINRGGVIDYPDANANGYGIEVYDWYASHIPYQGGQIMDAIVASGVSPDDLTGRDFTGLGHIWTYRELLQDMADMYAWGQNDGGTCNGGICGSWWYAWNYGSPGDNSASQWAAIGMIPAQQPPWNVVVPAWVKTYNANWLEYSMGRSGASYAYNFFSYNGAGGCAGDSCQQTTPSGMTQMIFDGQTTADPKWGRAQLYMANGWRSFLHDGSSWNGYRTYGWYSFAKAMRLALPSPVTQLSKNSGATFDWYYGNPSLTTCTNEANCEKGLAQRILETQAANGSWSNGNLTNPPLTTAWMIITLRPTVFAAAPIACFAATPNPSYADQDVFFDPSCSGHSETGKDIGNVTAFEWDWDNDGTFDASSALPDVQTHSFSCAVLPCTYPVTLKVTDDADPPLTATTVVNINITNPPHPPVANAGGPYTVSTCGNDTLSLQGGRSYDQDEGQHEAGCSTCPNDTLTAWDWDLRDPLTFDLIDRAGRTPLLTAGNIASFFTLGSQAIGLRVTDNTAAAYPGSGQPNLTNAAFAAVSVRSGAICNLAARPKSGKVQLTWTNIPGGLGSYDVYRSTEGPNTGFAMIMANWYTTYSTYLDSAVVNGTRYWYRVAPAGSATAISNAATATPVALR